MKSFDLSLSHHVLARRTLACLLIAIGVAALPLVLHAGGRFGTQICWDGGCSFKPYPSVTETQTHIKKALNAVFAEEEKTHPTLQAFIENPKGQSPYALASKELAELKKTNSKATNAELEQLLRSKKNMFAADSGITAYLDALDHPPTVTSFSPSEATTTDTIVIKGQNLLPITHVDFNGSLAYVEHPSESEIRIRVPKYINTIAGLPQPGMATQFKLGFVTRYGTRVESSGTFSWLDGRCTDARIGQAFQEMYGRPPRGSGVSGECAIGLYGSYSSAADLMITLASRGNVVQQAAPSISYVSVGRAQPGVTITISGLDLSQIKEVWFGSAKSPSFTSVDAYSLKAVVPTGGSGKIRIVTYSGSVESSFLFEVTEPPVIESVTPKEVVKGDPIFVHGKNFASNASGMLNGYISLNFRSVTPTDIVVLTDNVAHEPNATLVISGSGGSASTTVTVWNGLCSNPEITQAFDDLYARKPLGGYAAGECNPQAYGGGVWSSAEDLLAKIRAVRGAPSQARLPVISSVNPSIGSAGGLTTIRGNNFPYKATTVQFGNVLSREVSWQSRTEVQARIPDGAPSGSVTVSTPNGSASASFTVSAPLNITRITPGSGVAGSTIRIHGSGFEGAYVKIGEAVAGANVLSPQEIEATIPKVANGFVDVTVVRPDKMSITWPKFPIYQINLRIPDGAKSLKDTRVELVAPDGRVTGTSHLIGNAGSALTNDQIANLIGNAGAGLIGNAGSALIGNAGSALIGNAGSALSIGQLGNLIGNAGVSFDATSVTNLIGNAGAGLKMDLTSLIGNAGSALAGNFGSGLAGNNGSGLAGNFGSGLAGNNGSGLAGNYGSGFSSGQITTGLAGFSGELMSIGAARQIGSRSITSLSPYEQANPIVPSSVTEFTVPTSYQTETSPSVETQEDEPVLSETTTTQTYTTESSQTKLIETPSASVEPTAPEEAVEEAPVVQSPVVLPEESASDTSGETSGETTEEPVTTGAICNPNVPMYQQPGCVEEEVEAAPRSPYDGLPCPGDNVPSYSKIGCIPQ